jgi:hypothetical protein
MGYISSAKQKLANLQSKTGEVTEFVLAYTSLRRSKKSGPDCPAELAA